MDRLERLNFTFFPGYVSYRDTINGTWFVQALCSELKKKGTSKDLCEILTCVQKRVALHFEADKNKQMPCFTSMLTRLLIFTSKEVNKMEVNKMPDLLLSQDKSGQTAWHNAAEGGHVELLDKLWDWDKALQLKPEELRNGLLLSKGAFEQTAWHKAVIRGHVEILEKLWARGAVI
jgi:ankyrin repeat protein